MACQSCAERAKQRAEARAKQIAANQSKAAQSGSQYAEAVKKGQQTTPSK